MQLDFVYRGDCLEFLTALPDACVDSVVTDPPFKLSQEYSSSTDADNLLAVSSLWPVAQELFRVSKPGALAALFYDTRILPLALAAMRHAGWKYLRALTFYRKWGQCSLVHGWMSTSDFILIFTKPGEKYRFYGKARHDVYVKEKPESVNFGHPAQKPLEPVMHLVENLTPPGGVCLDPYMGTGTVAEAAIRTGRHFLGAENVPEYWDMIERRLHGLKVDRDSRPATEQARLFL